MFFWALFLVAVDAQAFAFHGVSAQESGVLFGTRVEECVWDGALEGHELKEACGIR